MTAPDDGLRAEVDAIPFWWHSIELGDGVITPGRKTPAILAAEVDAMRLPDLRGKTVLDIGAWDGYYSYLAESRGASRVVALDHFVWSRDSTADGPLLQDSAWHPDTLPGKRGFDLAHRARGSRVEAVVDDFLTTDLTALGSFDVVLYLGVLYHMEDPLAALRRLAQVTRGVAIIESEASVIPGYESLPLCEFFEGGELGMDPSNWWSPNGLAIEGMCRAAGFSRVETVQGPPQNPSAPPGRPVRYRHMLHAIR